MRLDGHAMYLGNCYFFSGGGCVVGCGSGLDQLLDTDESNNAYKIIVEEQRYIYGRDAHIKPVENVHREVEIGTPTRATVINR
ncbi:MAG: hypothetical protein MUP09_04200 [Thiovulaceae bacterium]|nr:hypothetical protein [Sulfurimonadaceae bacterium]